MHATCLLFLIGVLTVKVFFMILTSLQPVDSLVVPGLASSSPYSFSNNAYSHRIIASEYPSASGHFQLVTA